MKNKKKQKCLTIADKYRLYELSVQNCATDLEFVDEEYQKYFSQAPYRLREDFSGTGALSCAWVGLGEDYHAWGIDLSSEAIDYGMKNHFKKLSPSQQNRMQYIEADVLKGHRFQVDVIVAFNFSYFIFKKREILLNYFKVVKKGLTSKGGFFIDLFGGTECRQELVESTKYDEHTYYWDCERYNPITEEVFYSIHFKKKNGGMYRKVFTYDWRMWGMGTLRDLLYEAGFAKVITYWEGDEGESGDGNFSPTVQANNCESWVTFLVAFNQ